MKEKKVNNLPEKELKNQLAEIRRISFALENGCLAEEKKEIINILENITLTNIEEKKLVSELLGASVYLPKSIALKLANSSLEVSSKIIRYYANFTSKDIIMLISGEEDSRKLCLIAEREKMYPSVIEQLIKKGIDVAITLLKNTNIKLTIKDIAEILNRYSHSNRIMEMFRLIDDNDLKIAIEQVDTNLKEVVGQKFNTYLKKNQGFSELNILNINENNLFTYQEENTLKEKVDVFHSQNLLTNALIIRFLCKGDVYSFIYSLSKYSDIPFLSIKKIIFEDIDKEKFKKIYTATHLPKNMLNSIWLLLSLINKNIRSGIMNLENFHTIIKKELQSHRQNKRYKGIDFLTGFMC